MKPQSLLALGGTTLGVAGVAALLSSRRASRGLGPQELLYRSADDLIFEPLLPGVSQALLWGDPLHGPYGAFTRFDPGAQNPLHFHTHDIQLLVLSGAYLFRTREGELRVGPRSYLFIPGKTPHISLGDEREGCLFYETSSAGRFDLVPLE